MFDRIPEEMRLYRQWIVWRYEDKDTGKPTKVPYSPLTNNLASVKDPATWGSFTEAVHAAKRTDWYDGIGFVLTQDDPYCFVDLDDPNALNLDGSPKHKEPAKVYENQLKVFNEFQSYAELSPSGKGLHIICRASVPFGRRRDAIEIYSDERYMTMTGNVYRDVSIAECQQQATMLYEQMSQGKTAAAFYAGAEHAKVSDEKIIEISVNAANGEKFKDLFYDGNWQKHGYPSQSEADFALFDIIAYYSENGAQTQRIFLTSKLAERPKSRAQYRINYMLNRCFDRMLPPVDMDGLNNQMAEAIAKAHKKEQEALEQKPEKINGHSHSVKYLFEIPKNQQADVYQVPPGLVGEIAQYIYNAAPRPVPEIALAGAIGFMAGIVGRCYNISKTGLNQYVLLLAPTGTGKEAIASGVNSLMNIVVKEQPMAQHFIGPAEISSQQALIKHLGKSSSSLVSVVGEFGYMLQLLSTAATTPHLIGLKKLYLDLYNKSGQGNILHPMIYSDKEKNTSAVLSPAFTILGESTPESFYEALNENMIASGFLPRFTMIEYNGKRPELNQNRVDEPSFQLTQRLKTICAQALMLNSQNKVIDVQMDKQAEDIFWQYEIHCTRNINSSDKDIRKHLWNRGHMKAMKLAATVAVGCDPYNPTINYETARWAINLITSDIRNLLGRFDAGEIGVDNDETKQLSRMSAMIKEWVMRPWSEIEGYKCGTPQLHSEKLVPYNFLHKRLAGMAEFKKDRMGPTHAIKRSIKTFIERGDLIEVERKELVIKFQTHAASYVVKNPRAFGLG